MIGHDIFVPADGESLQCAKLLEIGDGYVLVGESAEERAPAFQWMLFGIKRFLHIPQECHQCKAANRVSPSTGTASP